LAPPHSRIVLGGSAGTIDAPRSITRVAIIGPVTTPGPTLWNVRLLDGRGGPPIEDSVVVVRDGRIAELGTTLGRSAPAGVLDLEGRTALPGLIDAHAHVISDLERSPGFGPTAPLHGEEPRPPELRWFVLAKAASALLRAGVTTVRDVGSFDDEAIVLREAIRLGLLAGPRIVSCGRIISATSPGGRIFGSMYAEATGPWEMRRAVREQIRRGADYIKVMATGARSVEREDPERAQLTLEELDAVVDEAHRMGYRVAAHAEGLDGARAAIEAGVDTIEHGLSLHRAPELLDLMAERGIVLVPTLSTFDDLAERFADDFAPTLVTQAGRQRDEAVLTVIAARAAGVTIAMGYDSGPPGANARELIRLVEAGLTPAEAVAAATSGSAASLGLTDHGTIAPGNVADVVVVDGDPLAEPALLADQTRIWLVLRGGDAVAGTVIDPRPLF
jgi:imidazolonepropionase-like amidohydrolase